MQQDNFDSNLHEDHGMVREYDTHRIPDDAVVDWEHEYLTYCHRCRKDLIISKDMPQMVYYCRNCREDILVETGQVHASTRKKSEDFIFSRMRNISPSAKNFNHAIVAILFALLILVLAAALELSKVNNFHTTLWLIFGLFAAVAIVFLLIAIFQRISEKKAKKGQEPEVRYEKLNGN